MIPVDLYQDIDITNEADQPDFTFGVVGEEKVSGFKDGIDAVSQAIDVMLNVERYEYYIYSWDYGVELSDLIGKDVAYCCPEIARRIKEALLQDERITDVDGWEFEQDNSAVSVTFIVHTVYGDINKRKEVEI